MLFGKKKKNDQKLDLDVPEFHPSELKKSILRTSEMPKFPSFDHEFGTIKKEIGRPVQTSKSRISEGSIDIPKVERASSTGSKPIFVKIENYKEAMESIDRIKALYGEADSLLDKIQKIRDDEDRELEAWHRDLGKVKEKLLSVDKRLFEL